MRRAGITGLIACLVAVTALVAQPAKPNLETVSYAELGKAVRAAKGKVVVVYFWAHY